jgi:hypothetical protein
VLSQLARPFCAVQEHVAEQLAVDTHLSSRQTTASTLLPVIVLMPFVVTDPAPERQPCDPGWQILHLLVIASHP